jgi:hypothetical protein
MKHLISAYAWIVGGLYFVLLLFICIVLSFFIPQKTLDPFIKGSLKILFKVLFIKVQGDEIYWEGWSELANNFESVRNSNPFFFKLGMISDKASSV